MADHAAALGRNDEQPQQQEESFDLTKRFHMMFIFLKLLVTVHFNSQHTEVLSHTILQLYIVCEAIYFIALIKVTEPTSPKLIYRCLYIIFGTLGSELLLWMSLSLVMWLVINISLLVFALACLLVQNPDRFQEIVQPFIDTLLS